jgi:hypothetical protein
LQMIYDFITLWRLKLHFCINLKELYHGIIERI